MSAKREFRSAEFLKWDLGTLEEGCGVGAMVLATFAETKVALRQILHPIMFMQYVIYMRQKINIHIH